MPEKVAWGLHQEVGCRRSVRCWGAGWSIRCWVLGGLHYVIGAGGPSGDGCRLVSQVLESWVV